MSSQTSAIPASTFIVRDNWHLLLEIAASEVFEMMIGSPLKLLKDVDEAVTSEFTAMVGLAGSLCGILSLRCSADSAALIACKMLGTAPGDTQDDSWDAVGEVCNMIAGNFKS